MFTLVSKNRPGGDQPKAIAALVRGVEQGLKHQTLLGVTGSGKTFTVANVIEAIGKPTLVIAHNKTLAAQLCNEFRELFPSASVNYFVSYYDYYQPEAYMPITDTYIEKEAMVNEEIDKLRHAATTALLTRRDVIVVASVSCIYGLGAPEAYAENIFHFKLGDVIDRALLVRKLIQLQYTRTTADLRRATFRLRGDGWEIMPPDREVIYDLQVENGAITRIYEIDPVKGFQPGKTPMVPEVIVAPAKHFVTSAEDRTDAIKLIQTELKDQLKKFEKEGKLLEAERLERRTKFDLAMMREMGYCHGIENYSRHLSGRAAGDPPDTLLAYFPKLDLEARLPDAFGSLASKTSKIDFPDFLTIIDESHITIPQIRGMYHGDQSRKKTLIDYGFRLPSAADNRPLTFPEFEARVGQRIYTSATPGVYELEHSVPKSGQFPARFPARFHLAGFRQGETLPKSKDFLGGQVVEQIIRPTGLVDPEVAIHPARGQVDHLLALIPTIVAKKERVMVTTLTKKMAEDLSKYLEDLKIKAQYLHSDVKTFDRIKILTEFRRGKFDVLVGVNLLREGLDLPEVSLVAILDADKEGFLRNETSLIQTIGRAARNVSGRVVMYADVMTKSIEAAVRETNRRRAIQLAYNKEHGITPTTIVKEIRDILPEAVLALELRPIPDTKLALEKLVKEKEKQMKRAAKELDFELATILRDEIKVLTHKVEGMKDDAPVK